MSGPTGEPKRPVVLTGRARLVPVADVDTDMIFHNRHLHLVDRGEMGRHIFGNLPGYESFPQSCQAGDILITGANFGCGSSRQQAVDGLIALGIAALAGVSFGAIYKRNAVSAGLPIIIIPEIFSAGIAEGDRVTLDLQTGMLGTPEGRALCTGRPLDRVQMDIYQAGGLLNLA